MQLRFKAKGISQPDYQISGETINGLDLLVFPEGGKFIGDDTTQAAGIYDVTRENGELFVTLAQNGVGYECRPTNGSHDWGESDWIDAATFDNATCYIVASSAPPDAEYVKRDGGWTVALPETEGEVE